MPALKTEVNKELEEVNVELARLGDKVPDNKDGQRLLLTSVSSNILFGRVHFTINYMIQIIIL